jgi:metal-responsive CopG/Arc/MetJ family transcriptional regulator
MNRKTIKTRTGAYHVTLPIRLVEEFDESLSFKQSRSRMIAKLIENYLEGDQINIGSMTKKQIVIALMNQVDSSSAEYIMLDVLKDVFTYDDPSSS